MTKKHKQESGSELELLSMKAAQMLLHEHNIEPKPDDTRDFLDIAVDVGLATLTHVGIESPSIFEASDFGRLRQAGIVVTNVPYGQSICHVFKNPQHEA